MPALIAGMVARFTFRRQAKLARRWQQLAALTPDALPFCDRYVEEVSGLWYVGGPNNCYTYANCTRRTRHSSEAKTPGGCSKTHPAWPLAQRLLADGWISGLPDKVTAEAHICVAFEGVDSEVPGLLDYHFYRLGPDGWSHRLGDNAAERCDNPFTGAKARQYGRFHGWWTVPHNPAHNLVVNDFYQKERALRGPGGPPPTLE
jgi:hypothetical protein